MTALPESRTDSRGQALVEFALVAPLFFMLVLGIIVLGFGVFQQQQITNAAREAARYAAVHSASARCPTVSAYDPANPPTSYDRCDRPQEGWPKMTAAGRGVIVGINPAAIRITPCWSGYVLYGNTPPNGIDAPPPGVYTIVDGQPPVTVVSEWMPCTIDGVDPTASPDNVACAAGIPRIDTASAASEGQGIIVANQVTVHACMVWSPPGAGFLLIPQQVVLRAVVTEPIERQQ